MEHYKKFYEINNNRYYTIIADNEEYIANESFINLDKKRLFRKQKDLITGFKVLKFSPAIATLFVALNDLQPSKKQRYDSDDLIIYDHIDNKELKENIRQAYLQVLNNDIDSILQKKTDAISKNNIELINAYDKTLEDLKRVNPMAGINLETPEHSGCMIVKTMLKDGLEHLYTERVNAFTKNIYLYEQDEFGNLTIYRLITVKNVVKSIDTFIYDKKLVSCLLKTLYEEGR